MIHDTTTCACEMCTYFDKQVAERHEHVYEQRQGEGFQCWCGDVPLYFSESKLPEPADTYFDFLWQYGPPSKVGVPKDVAAWWFRMGRGSGD